MGNIIETFRHIDYSNPDSFIKTPEGRIELKRYSDDLVFYSNFDSTVNGKFGNGSLTPTLEGDITNHNEGVFGQYIKINNGHIKYDKSNFIDLKKEGSISLFARPDFNNAKGYQNFIRTEDPLATGLPTLDKSTSKFGGGSLNLLGDEEKRIAYDVLNVSTLTQTGTIDFFIKTNYNGTPTKGVSFFDLTNETNENRILITHEIDGMLHYRIYDQIGTLKVHIYFSWSANSEVWFNTSLNFDLNNGDTKAFINGQQYGITSTATATRIALINGKIVFGSSNNSYISNYYIDEIAIFNVKKFNNNYSIRKISFPDTENNLLLNSKMDISLNLSVGNVLEPIEIYPETNDYYFKLLVDKTDVGGDIPISLTSIDTMIDVFNKISSALSSYRVLVKLLPEGNISIEALDFGASIEIFSPDVGRDLLQILDGVESPKLPNGPSEDTAIIDLYNGINNSCRISIIHTINSHIIIKMWDEHSNLKVNEDCGEWTNWSYYWYKLELNWGESIGQFFIDGEMKKVFPTLFVRESEDNFLYLNSSLSEAYNFDELIIYDTYKHTKNYTLQGTPLTPYDSTNPYIDINFGDGFKENEVVGLSLNSSANTHYTIKIGSVWYYYFSGGWRKGNGTFEQSTSPSNLETKFSELYFDENVDIIIRAFFSSDGEINQWIDDISILIDSDSDYPAVIIGSVSLISSVDLSSDQHIIISTGTASEEVDLTSTLIGTPAEIIGTINLSNGFDWNTAPQTLEINGTSLTLNTLTENIEEVIALLTSSFPGIEVFYTEEGFIGFKTIELGSNETIDISGTSLTTFGITEDAYTGADPDLTSVEPEKIIEAINAANIDGLALAYLDDNGRIILSSIEKGEGSYIAISEGVTSNALDIIWGFATSDSGEASSGPFIDYTIIKDWIREQLGAPIAPVELTDEQLENCISLATYWYNYYRNSKENLIYVKLDGDEKTGYIIPKEIGGEEDIIEIIVKPRFPFAYYTGGDVDSIMSNIYMQWMFQRGRNSGFNDFLGDYYLTLSAEKDYNIILGTEIRWRFYNGRLFIKPSPVNMDVIIIFRSALTIEEINTNTLIREYSLGEAKKVLGTIRSTFGGQVPGGAENLTLNGDSLKSEGAEETTKALEKMMGLMEPFGFDFG